MPVFSWRVLQHWLLTAPAVMKESRGGSATATASHCAGPSSELWSIRCMTPAQTGATISYTEVVRTTEITETAEDYCGAT